MQMQYLNRETKVECTRVASWHKLGRLLHEALELEPRRRAHFLAEVCARDTALKKEIETLLYSHETAGSFLASER